MSANVESSFWFGSDPEICVHTYRRHFSKPPLEIPAHTHDEYNLLFCRKGRLLYWVRDRFWELRAGDLLIINPGEQHRSTHADCDVTEGISFHISAASLWRLIDRMRLPVAPGTRVLFDDLIAIPELIPMLDELEAEIAVTRHGSDLLAQALVMKIMVLLLRQALRPRILPGEFRFPRQLPSWQIVRAFEYMNRTGKSAFSLPELCSECGSSASRLIALFKHSCGDASPALFHTQLLMQKADHLLASEPDSVKEIAFLLGFQNESHFCKTFRQLRGTSPGVWREGMFLNSSAGRINRFEEH